MLLIMIIFYILGI